MVSDPRLHSRNLRVVDNSRVSPASFPSNLAKKVMARDRMAHLESPAVVKCPVAECLQWAVGLQWVVCPAVELR